MSIHRSAASFIAIIVITGAARAQEQVDFARDIQPLFRERCVECHGPSQQMRGLRLDRRRDAMPNRVGANGARIVPGNSAGSLLYRRVSTTQSGMQMPPTASLRPEQVALLKRWIDQGANWPDELSGDTDTAPADPAVVRLRNTLRDGDLPAFRRALGENPEMVNRKGAGGSTPLMYAALYGNAETVRLLLEKGADPNARNDHGGTALMYAVDDPEKIRVLLDRGADPNLRSGEGKTAVLIAAGMPGAYASVKLLLDKNADVTVRLPDGRGALAIAAGARDPKVLQLLLDRGVDKKTVPLGPVLVRGCGPCFDLLLPLAGAADLAGGLQAAVQTGDVARVHTLLDRGARPGANLLFVVAAAPAAIPADTIRALIRAGASADAKTSSGLSVLDFAKRHGNARLIDAMMPSIPAGGFASPPPRAKAAGSARAAIETVLPMLQRADVAFLDRAGCVSCHNNSLTAMTVASARGKSVKFDEQIAKAQSRRIAAYLQENAERALENDGIPGAVDTVSYIMMGLAAAGYPSDPITDTWARDVKNNQAPDGRGNLMVLRPPVESSDFEVTAAAIRSLRAYAPKARKLDYDRAIGRAVHWLETARPLTNEDLTFQILGLIWASGNPAAIRTAARSLLAMQRPDGGWSQTAAMPSDAYATGQAMVALHEARAIPVDAPSYRRGVQYLLNSRAEDGSWHVISRATALQPYFDSDFPHGPDQFISAAASNWASMALMTVVR